MGKMEDPFEPLPQEAPEDDADLLRTGTVALSESPMSVPGSVVTGRLHAFDLDDRPLVSELAEVPGEVIHARSTVRLLREQIGATVVVAYERGDFRRPIVMGVLQDHAPANVPTDERELVSIKADEDRFVVSAEREIVLRCGDASITLTRAGKVLIKGNYVLSRSTGYNKIKGAAIDIN